VGRDRTNTCTGRRRARRPLDGFKVAAWLGGDSEFDPIGSDPGFRAILADIAFPADPFASR